MNIRSTLRKGLPGLDCALLFLLTAILILPLFRLKYLNIWSSIESTFISDGRMLAEHLPHPNWQPLWYCGTRFDYIYPPALRYGTALISKIDHLSPARAYHLYTAMLYSFGIVAVYLLVWAGCRSRRAAWLGAAATALLSPSFLLLKIIRYDSPDRVPQRLHVLMSYGEGPHISALSVLPAALALSFLALRRWNPAAFAGAGLLCAFTVANNFYGATALAIFFPLAAWSVWVGERRSTVWLRAAGIPLLAYLLCAPWLTLSYLRITASNLELVATPGDTRSRVVALIVVALYCAISFRWANRHPERDWTIFAAGAGIVMSLYVLGLYYFNLHIVGEAGRLIPELDLALILVFVEVIRRLSLQPKLRPVAVVAVVIAFWPALHYLRHAYSPFPKAGSLTSQYEYHITQWVHDHLPGERVLPSGSVRFWYDAWFDNAQMDGGSQQGLLNRLIPIGGWQITAGDRADLAVLWLKCLGTDAVIVPGKQSLDQYRDYPKPEKFRGALPVLYDNGHDTVIYRVPRIQPGIGRVVDTQNITSVLPPFGGDDQKTLERYASIVENPNQKPTTVTWKGFDEIHVQASTLQGQSVLVQETYDPAWKALENGKPLAIRADPMNFMLIAVPEGTHDIQMRFETPLENRAGQFLFLAGLAIVVAAAVAGAGRVPE